MLRGASCDDCAPSYLQRRGLASVTTSAVVLSTLPFVLTWAVTVFIAHKSLFPILSSDASRQDAGRDRLPLTSRDGIKEPGANKWRARISKPSAQKLASAVFSTSIGLSTVLVELLLCEVSNLLNPVARALALEVTLGGLLALVILVTPALEIHGTIRTIFGYNSTDTVSTRRRGSSSRSQAHFLVEAVILICWLLVFWYIPQASILRKSLEKNERWRTDTDNHFSEQCLERVGIIGISLMASLSGFAAVSSLWQTFGVRRRPITESELARKAAGLQSAEEMLAAKRSRVRAIQHRMQDAPPSSPADHGGGIVGRMFGAMRGSCSNHEANELKVLQMEVSGLETMRFTLATSLSNVEARFAEQERSKTASGKLFDAFNLVFAIYCGYRIAATAVSAFRRWWQPAHSFATSDPINNILALMTSHWDRELDRAAWSRQFSFLLSGFMLLASFNAVLQTFRLFARFAPGLVQHAQTSLPLIISQFAGTYVIASAILLGSNLPSEMSSVVTDAVGAPLEGRFIEGWFEGWFLLAVALTALGIFIGRKIGRDGTGGSSSDDDWDDVHDRSVDIGAVGKRH